MKLSVSAIIVNRNGAEHLRVCLPSLLAQSYQPIEIIVVDNNSSDDSRQVARASGAKWLALEENVGLAPALNRGVAVANGEFLLFVNNDMRFDDQFVAHLASCLQDDGRVFAADGMQFNWDGTVRGHLAARLTATRSRRESSAELVPGLYFYQQEKSERTPVFMASAACMMVRRALFDELGGFDDRLPLGYEDVEICWRAWVRRQTTVYVPSAICWHRVGSSVHSAEARRFSFRGVLTGRLLLATKLLPARYAVRTWLVSTTALAKDISRLQWRSAADRLGVLFQMAGLVRPLLREKRALFESGNNSPGEQLDFLLRLTDNDLLQPPEAPKSGNTNRPLVRF
jgi:GT2 family glycosyltransferase